MDDKLLSLLRRQRYSKPGLWILNKLLSAAVPFNQAHGLQILALEDANVVVRLPYKRANYNHVRGIHACALATLAEYAAGLLLLRNVSAQEYRLLMEKLEVEYRAQARTDVFCRLNLEPEWLEETVKKPLQTEESVSFVIESPVECEEQERVCVARIQWQLKRWDAVRSSRSRPPEL